MRSELRPRLTWTSARTADRTSTTPTGATAREAAQGAPRAVVVHLQEVDRLDTSATQILLSLQRHLAASGRAFRVEGTPPAVAELWRRAGLLELIGKPC